MSPFFPVLFHTRPPFSPRALPTRCDGENNKETCSWDGGDCCASSCVSSTYTCGAGSGNDYDCLDPSAESECGAVAAGHESYVGDGWCDEVSG